MARLRHRISPRTCRRDAGPHTERSGAYCYQHCTYDDHLAAQLFSGARLGDRPERVAANNGSLRTMFPLNDGSPVQAILDSHQVLPSHISIARNRVISMVANPLSSNQGRRLSRVCRATTPVPPAALVVFTGESPTGGVVMIAGHRLRWGHEFAGTIVTGGRRSSKFIGPRCQRRTHPACPHHSETDSKLQRPLPSALSMFRARCFTYFPRSQGLPEILGSSKTKTLREPPTPLSHQRTGKVLVE